MGSHKPFKAAKKTYARSILADTKSHIQDIPDSVKQKKRTSGIVGLNLLLDGGFPEGTIIMVYGTPLAGEILQRYSSGRWKEKRAPI